MKLLAAILIISLMHIDLNIVDDILFILKDILISSFDGYYDPSNPIMTGKTVLIDMYL